MNLTHASFFSGVGGLDMGLEKAGWTTVSFSEIDPYASAVLARHWPEVPNLGDITQIRDIAQDDWSAATLWTGGFPCQDLSVAGKRAGFDGDRSSLAFTFLDLVERYRPPAFLLENVIGLVSSNGGRDMARLVAEILDLGYGVAWRALDARYFGVPQRRRRIFCLALRSDRDDPDCHLAAERAAQVLSVGTRCGRHPVKGSKTRSGSPADTYGGAYETVGALPAGVHGFPDGVQEFMQGHFRVAPTSPSPDLRGDGEIDGMAGRAHDREGLASAEGMTQTFVKVTRPHGPDGDGERWALEDTSPTLNFDVGDTRAVTLVAPTVNSNKAGGWRFDADQAESLVLDGRPVDDPLLPEGLDSHRYRACGNGVVSPVAEWIGHRLAQYFSQIDEPVSEVDWDARDAEAERQFLRPINPDPVTGMSKTLGRIK